MSHGCQEEWVTLCLSSGHRPHSRGQEEAWVALVWERENEHRMSRTGSCVCLHGKER